MTQLAYHYTNELGARGALLDGKINPTVYGPNKDNLSAVWFSIDPKFDNGAGTYVRNEMGSFRRTMDWWVKTCGLFRFSIDESRTITMLDAFLQGHISGATHRVLHEGAIRNGAYPQDWRMCVGAGIPISLIESCDCYVDGRWQVATASLFRRMRDQSNEWVRSGALLPTAANESVLAQSLSDELIAQIAGS